MSEMPQESFQVGAYFYPLTKSCPSRDYRAWRVGDALQHEDMLESPDEFAIIRDAPALFEGHQQPKTYCLSDKITEWDDYYDDTLASQIVLARMAGLSYFVFNSYTGLRNGETYKELTSPLHRLAQMDEAERLYGAPSVLSVMDFKYARMEIFESPRVVLPMPHTEAGGAFAEPNRNYDITPASARFVVDSNVPHWRSPNYLRVGWRPYLGILMPNFRDTPEEVRAGKMKSLVETIRDYAYSEYGEQPYIAGVIRGQGDAERWLRLGADAITHYANLPDFGRGAPPIQDYATMTAQRRQEWEELSRLAEPYGVPFMPAPSVGWDASPRGERGHTWEEVAGKFPFSPIITGNTPELIGEHLGKAIEFALEHTLYAPRRFVTAFAWNEVGEGGTLLPELRPDGTIDRSRLEAVRRTIERARALGAVTL